MTKDIAYYLSLPYIIQYQREDDGSWFARVKELEGCMTVGYDYCDAYHMIRDAMRGWLLTAIDCGIKIPEPIFVPRYEGDTNGREGWSEFLNVDDMWVSIEADCT
jgi:predicted RNase H-like HicB family nuclease